MRCNKCGNTDIFKFEIDNTKFKPANNDEFYTKYGTITCRVCDNVIDADKAKFDNPYEVVMMPEKYKGFPHPKLDFKEYMDSLVEDSK